MPSSPVHLKVAYLMCDELGIKNKADFILGAISPDCVNLSGFASEELRYGAHIRVRDYDLWKKKLVDFYNDNKEKYKANSDFLKGYLFHCWTDIAWDEVVQPKLFEYLGTLGFGYDDMTKQKWQELYRFNGKLVREPYFAEVRKLVKAAQPQNIAACDIDTIIKYRDYVADDYKDKIYDEEPKFLNDKHIDDTMSQMRKQGYIKQFMGA